MPRLSTLGSAVMGIGGIETSVDGTTPAALVGSVGGWDWLNTTTIVGQSDFGSGFKVYTYDVNTLVLTEVDATGANDVWAGGDVWQKWLSGEGVKTSTPPALVLPVAGPGAVNESGTSVVIVTRDTGFGLRSYDNAGTVLFTWNALLTSSVIRARSSVMSYQDAEGWQLRNVSTGAVILYAAQTEDVNWLVPALNGSDLWVLERSAADVLTLRGAQSSNAFTIATGAMLFNPDVRFLSSTVARIAWSTTSGEAAGDLVLMDLNIANGTNTVATIVGGTPVFVAGTPIAPTPVSTSGGSSNLKRLFAGLYQEPVVEKTNGRMTVPWYRALSALAESANTPIDLGSNQVTGVLPEPNGGTGNDAGEVVNGGGAPVTAQYIVAAADPVLTAERVATDTASIAWDFSTAGQAKADVVSYWIPLVDGAEPPGFITDGSGNLILTAYNP